MIFCSAFNHPFGPGFCNHPQSIAATFWLEKLPFLGDTCDIKTSPQKKQQFPYGPKNHGDSGLNDFDFDGLWWASSKNELNVIHHQLLRVSNKEDPLNMCPTKRVPWVPRIAMSTQKDVWYVFQKTIWTICFGSHGVFTPPNCRFSWWITGFLGCFSPWLWKREVDDPNSNIILLHVCCCHTYQHLPTMTAPSFVWVFMRSGIQG